MRQNQRRILNFAARAGMVVLFLLFSTIMIASANGFLFDKQSLRFEETGNINLMVKQEPLIVMLNGLAKEYNREDIRLTYLRPGSYTLEVAKPGYISWMKTFDLHSGEVILNPFVLLFRSPGGEEPATPEQAASLADSQSVPYIHADMDVRGSEIWVHPISRTYPFTLSGGSYELIGRYISPVLGARWFEGKNRVPTHIVFQIDREIRVMDRDGSNDITLVTLKSGEATPFIVDNDNKLLIYRDGNETFQRPLL